MSPWLPSNPPCKHWHGWVSLIGSLGDWKTAVEWGSDRFGGALAPRLLGLSDLSGLSGFSDFSVSPSRTFSEIRKKGWPNRRVVSYATLATRYQAAAGAGVFDVVNRTCSGILGGFVSCLSGLVDLSCLSGLLRCSWSPLSSSIPRVAPSPMSSAMGSGSWSSQLSTEVV